MMTGQTATARQVIREGTARLQAAGLLAPPMGTVEAGQAPREAEWLLGRLMGMRPLDLYLDDRDVPGEVTAAFFSHIEARASGAPLQYLLGEAEFCGESFAVAPGVFIPRPETETVVEAAVDAWRAAARRLQRPLRVLDLGTGSGCLAVVVARALPTCVVVGVELSWEALRIAKANVLRHGVSQRVRLVQGRWAEAIRGTWDGVISNPPYIPSAEVDGLPLDVRREPRVSLDGGTDGMHALLQLLAEAPRLLAPRGVLVLECGPLQVTRLIEAVRSAPWVECVAALRDLAERPRGLVITRS